MVAAPAPRTAQIDLHLKRHRQVDLKTLYAAKAGALISASTKRQMGRPTKQPKSS